VLTQETLVSDTNATVFLTMSRTLLVLTPEKLYVAEKGKELTSDFVHIPPSSPPVMAVNTVRSFKAFSVVSARVVDTATVVVLVVVE